MVLAEQKQVKELQLSISLTLVRNQDISKTVLHFSVYLNQSCGKCVACDIHFTVFFIAYLSLQNYAIHVCFGSYTLFGYNNKNINFQISS